MSTIKQKKSLLYNKNFHIRLEPKKSKLLLKYSDCVCLRITYFAGYSCMLCFIRFKFYRATKTGCIPLSCLKILIDNYFFIFKCTAMQYLRAITINVFWALCVLLLSIYTVDNWNPPIFMKAILLVIRT